MESTFIVQMYRVQRIQNWQTTQRTNETGFAVG